MAEYAQFYQIKCGIFYFTYAISKLIKGLPDRACARRTFINDLSQPGFDGRHLGNLLFDARDLLLYITDPPFRLQDPFLG